ncbi:MAG: riboflavin synthase [Candidatus Saccharimonadales bacterium]|nr:riboflavin synthase [Candidatus Saccharimonadales bacterium]
MFTGIIQTIAEVTHSSTIAGSLNLEIAIPEGWELTLGQSIAVNGACLTITKLDTKTFTVNLMPETQKKTTFGKNVPEQVNLELAMAASGRFEGHIVQGHVDTVGTVSSIKQQASSQEMTITFPSKYKSPVVDKGSIAIDGVSLTVIRASSDSLSVGLIPYTLKHTTLGDLRRGDSVNLEFDIIGKYIAKQKGGL